MTFQNRNYWKDKQDPMSTEEAGEGEHSHCDSCFRIKCRLRAQCPSNACDFTSCPLLCGAVYHSCKADEHKELCPNEIVPCINLFYGCHQKMHRFERGRHLATCPASVIYCTMEWNRWPVFSKERQDRVPFSQKNLHARHGQLDVDLTMRDQRVLYEAMKVPMRVRRSLRNRLTERFPAVPLTGNRSSYVEVLENNSTEATGVMSDEDDAEKAWLVSDVQQGDSKSNQENTEMDETAADPGDSSIDVINVQGDTSNLCEKIEDGNGERDNSIHVKEEICEAKNQPLAAGGNIPRDDTGIIGNTNMDDHHEDCNKGEIDIMVAGKEICTQNDISSVRSVFSDSNTDLIDRHETEAVLHEEKKTTDEKTELLSSVIGNTVSESKAFRDDCLSSFESVLVQGISMASDVISRSKISSVVSEDGLVLSENLELLSSEGSSHVEVDPMQINFDLPEVVMQTCTDSLDASLSNGVDDGCKMMDAVEAAKTEVGEIEDLSGRRETRNENGILCLSGDIQSQNCGDRLSVGDILDKDLGSMAKENGDLKMSELTANEDEFKCDSLAKKDDFEANGVVTLENNIDPCVNSHHGLRDGRVWVLNHNNSGLLSVQFHHTNGNSPGSVECELPDAFQNSDDCSLPPPANPPPLTLQEILALDLNLESITRYQAKPRSMYTFLCAQNFRRDEYEWHFKNTHSDIHGGLNGWIEARCPLACYGCTYSSRRLNPVGGTVVYNSIVDGFGVCPDSWHCRSISENLDAEFNKPVPLKSAEFLQKNEQESGTVEEGPDQESSAIKESVDTENTFEFARNHSELQDDEAGDGQDRLSVLPFEVLRHIARCLDSFSLCNLALTSFTLREVCKSIVETRGIVVQEWEKKQFDSGFSWQVTYQRWLFSTAFTPVELWKFEKSPNISEHLKTCSFNILNEPMKLPFRLCTMATNVSSNSEAAKILQKMYPEFDPVTSTEHESNLLSSGDPMYINRIGENGFSEYNRALKAFAHAHAEQFLDGVETNSE